MLNGVIPEPGYGSEKQGKERVFVTTDELPKITGDAQFRQVNKDQNIVDVLNMSAEDSGVFSFVRHGGSKWYGSMQLGNPATDNTDVLHLAFGKNQPHNTLPPSIACYGWRRTA